MSDKFVKLKKASDIKFKLGYSIELRGEYVIIRDKKTNRNIGIPVNCFQTDKLLVTDYVPIGTTVLKIWPELFESEKENV